MVMIWNFVLGLVNHDFDCTPFVFMNWTESANEIPEDLSLDWETLCVDMFDLHCRITAVA